MELIKISLGGNFAHFGINGSNGKNRRYSFPHIPGSTIKGILGAIGGYRGWNQLEKNEKIPEFLDKLKNIQYAVVPKKSQFRSFFHGYNNTTGVNKNDNGATSLQVHEEFLEDVFWDIYILNIPKDIEKNILENKSVYPIFLGKKGCFINFFLGKKVVGETVIAKKVQSIFPVEFLGEEENNDIEEDDDLFSEKEINYDFIFQYSEDFFQNSKSYAFSKNILKEKTSLIKVEDTYLYMIGDKI